MTARILPFRTPASVPSCDRLPLVLTARRGAIEMVIGDVEPVELHMDPDQADELGRDLIRMAEEARGNG